MNTPSSNTLTYGAKSTVSSHPRWKKVLRRILVVVFAAPIMIVPASVMAVVAVTKLPPIAVPISGTVGTGIDAVDINGLMTITARIIPDLDFGSPTNVELIVDFSSVKGNGKAKNLEKFTSEAQVIIHRPLLAFDPIEITFPYYAGNSTKSAKTAKATLAINFNAKTGIKFTSGVTDVPLQ